MPFALLYAEASLFLLPDEQSRFVHHLSGVLKGPSDEILIVTPSFRHAELKKTLLKSARKNSRITLIVQELKGDPLSMVQYENTDLYTFGTRPLQGSLILIDSRLVCTLPGRIEDQSFTDAASIVRCSDDAAEAAAYRAALLPLLRRSEKYLK